MTEPNFVSFLQVTLHNLNLPQFVSGYLNLPHLKLSYLCYSCFCICMILQLIHHLSSCSSNSQVYCWNRFSSLMEVMGKWTSSSCGKVYSFLWWDWVGIYAFI